MKEIIVKTQKEIDALPKSFSDYTRILIQSPADVWVSVNFKYEGADVVALGSSHVEAWGSSHVEARELAFIRCQSEFSSLTLFGFAVAILIKKCTALVIKSKTTTVVNQVPTTGTIGWLDSQGVDVDEKLKSVTLFKRVSKDFRTQEGLPQETAWTPGLKLTHKNWNPTIQECGDGKFHACSRPYFCDEFRSLADDVYVAIQIPVEELHAWNNPNYPHKIAFRTGTVLYQCDKFGSKV